MANATPFSSLPLIDTSRRDEAEGVLSSMITQLEILRVSARDPFHLQMNGVSTGRNALLFNRFGAHTHLRAKRIEEAVLLILGGETPCVFTADGKALFASSDRGVILSPGQQVRIERPRDSAILILRAPLSALVSRLEMLIRSSTRGAPEFCQEVDLSGGAGAQVKRLLTYLKAESDRDESILAQPILRKRFDDMLVDALLALPHDHSQEMAAGGNLPVAPYHVRRAEEYMRANSHKPFSIEDLLALCECSRSALFEGFKRFRGTTPKKFLTEQRLQAVRKKLLQANPGDSVGSTAMECGFTNLGHFSRTYCDRFGELPSRTLCRSS
jgi:AraC-like DNA-binding protein